MKSGRFCPKCGSTEPPFIDGFCKKCSLKTSSFVEFPEEINIDKCKECGKIKERFKLITANEQLLGEYIHSKIKISGLSEPQTTVELFPLEDGNFEAKVGVKGFVKDVPMLFTKSIPVKFRSVLCDPCMRLSSNYWESQLQLRYEKEPSPEEYQKITKEVKSILDSNREKDALSGIVSQNKTQKGFDFKIGSKRAGKVLADHFSRKFNSEVVRSATLAGIDKKGKTKKRYTFCVRVKEG
jgi:NMD protein affecting ribosome stability and mRNA decay